MFKWFLKKILKCKTVRSDQIRSDQIRSDQIRSDQIWGTIIALTFLNEIKIPKKRNIKM